MFKSEVQVCVTFSFTPLTTQEPGQGGATGNIATAVVKSVKLGESKIAPVEKLYV